MKIFTYVDEKARRYRNNYQPFKDSIFIVVFNLLLLLFIALVSLYFNNSNLLLIGFLGISVAIILEVINFTSKRNIDLSCLVIKDTLLLVIKVNPLVKEEELMELVTDYNKTI